VSADVAAADQAVGSHTPLRFLPLAIRVPRGPFRAIAIGWLTAFPISMILAVIASFIIPGSHPEFDVDGGLALFALVVFSPVLETLIMGGVLLILLRLVPESLAIAISAVGWGIVHSLAAPVWGLVIWWPFLIFSTLFVTWRKRSLALAFALPMCVHALQNLLPAILVARGMAG
jgi:hypothetical protein